MALEMAFPELERSINPTHDIKLFSGRSNPKLAQEIADSLGTTVGPVVTPMRVGITDCWRIRRILWTGRVKPTDTYYLRIKNVLTNTEKCCLLDYLEWCPKHVYDAAVAEDEW